MRVRASAAVLLAATLSIGVLSHPADGAAVGAPDRTSRAAALARLAAAYGLPISAQEAGSAFASA